MLVQSEEEGEEDEQNSLSQLHTSMYHAHPHILSTTLFSDIL